jgi:hypothetical protein
VQGRTCAHAPTRSWDLRPRDVPHRGDPRIPACERGSEPDVDALLRLRSVTSIANVPRCSRAEGQRHSSAHPPRVRFRLGCTPLHLEREPHMTASTHEGQILTEAAESRFSRRAALTKVGIAAAAGAGAALGSGILAATPASADTGVMYYGLGNSAGASLTYLTSTSSNYTSGVYNTSASGTALSVASTGGYAISALSSFATGGRVQTDSESVRASRSRSTTRTTHVAGSSRPRPAPAPPSVATPRRALALMPRASRAPRSVPVRRAPAPGSTR